MAEQEQKPIFNIQRIYLKDMSIEQPNSPGIFLEQTPPTVDVEINVGFEPLEDGISEVSVAATVTAKINDKIAFLVEAKQAGIFELRHIPNNDMDPLLGIACPSIVYPYLRANVADAIGRAGFQPIHLSEINFQLLYEQRRAELLKNKGANGVAAGATEKTGAALNS